MKGPGKYEPFLIGTSNRQLARMYGKAGKLPANQLVINPDFNVAKERSFDLSVVKNKETLRIDESRGWIIRNKFSTMTKIHSYGIVSRMLFDGVVRYHKNGQIFQVREETIECESLKDETVFDVYFSWDGMIGTNSEGGGANFNISMSVAWEDQLKLLSQIDGVSALGAKNVKGRSQLAGNLVRSKGTRVTFVLHYEMRVDAMGTPMSVSEIHFEEPVNNYFKIVTR